MPDSDPNNLQLEGLPFGKVVSTDVLLDDLKMKDKTAAGDRSPFLTQWNKVMSFKTHTYDNVDWMYVTDVWR